MQPQQPWTVPYSPKQHVPEYQCHHDDCRRTFVRKTSLTNHLKAHQNVRSRSIYRTKRARLRAAAARAAAQAAASVEKAQLETETDVDTNAPSLLHSPALPPQPPQPHLLPEKLPEKLPETSPVSSAAAQPADPAPQPPLPENAESLLNDISLSLVSPLSFTPQEEPLLPAHAWAVEQPLPIHIRTNHDADPDPSFQFPAERSDDLLDPADPNYDFLHDLYKYH